MSYCKTNFKPHTYLFRNSMGIKVNTFEEPYGQIRTERLFLAFGIFVECRSFCKMRVFQTLGFGLYLHSANTGMPIKQLDNLHCKICLQQNIFNHCLNGAVYWIIFFPQNDYRERMTSILFKSYWSHCVLSLCLK